MIPMFGVVWWQSFDPRESEPTVFTTSPEKCAELFDKIFDTWKQHVQENYGGPGQPTLEPLTVAELISRWKGGEEFRNTDCRFSVDNWGNLVKHKDNVWGHVDWPNLEPFKYVPSKYGDAYTNIEVLLGEPKQDKLLPIIIREYTRKANDFDSITSWDFSFVKNTAETQKTKYWKFLPQDERISYNVIGGNFTSIIDKTRKHSFDIPATSYLTEVDCESAGLKEVVTAVPVTFPIISDNYHVIVEHKRYGIYPDENDVYSFKMVSFFNINDNFPDTALMLSEEKYSCDWIEKPSSDLIDQEYPTEPTYVEWKFKLYEKQNPE